MSHNESLAGLSLGARRRRSPATGLALLTILSLMAGVFLLMVTCAVEGAGIEGPGWSLRGNGALVVPVDGLPVILLGAWALLARWLQADRRSCLSGLGAGLCGLLLAGLLASLQSWVLFPLTLLVACLLALRLAHGSGQWRAAGWLIAGTLVLPIAVSAGVLVGASVSKC